MDHTQGFGILTQRCGYNRKNDTEKKCNSKGKRKTYTAHPHTHTHTHLRSLIVNHITASESEPTCPQHGVGVGR